MNKFFLYSWAIKVVVYNNLPDFPVVEDKIKINITDAASEFLRSQIKPPTTLYKNSSNFVGIFLGASIALFGKRIIFVWLKLPFGKLFVRLIRSLVFLIFFEEPNILNAMGEESGENRVIRFRKKNTMNKIGYKETKKLDCDALVIGSGAGGAIVANELAKEGRDVLLVEEGHHIKYTNVPSRLSQSFSSMWRNGGLSLARGRSTSVAFLPRGVVLVGGRKLIVPYFSK